VQPRVGAFTLPLGARLVASAANAFGGDPTFLAVASSGGAAILVALIALACFCRERQRANALQAQLAAKQPAAVVSVNNSASGIAVKSWS
jgi:hypothetical protein